MVKICAVEGGLGGTLVELIILLVNIEVNGGGGGPVVNVGTCPSLDE